jgi:cytochrome c oxidase subunit I+III
MTRDVAALHDEMNRIWANPHGWRALSIVNHSSIGIRFMLTGAVFFLLAGLMAMLMRAQLARPEAQVLNAEVYNQLFTMHGSVMMFLFAVPMLQGLAAYLIPKMIGARDLVFPRLSALGYWAYLFGGLILLSSLVLAAAPDTGWFMYVPLSSQPYSPGPNADFWLLGITFVEVATMASAIEMVVSILRTRASGMSLPHMPIFAWYMLVTSLMIIVGFPPLILGSILLELERAAGWSFFDVTRGGDPVLWQHLFWLFGHPEVYIIFLPAAGIVSTVLPAHVRHPLVGYLWAVVAVITTGFISFGLWVHHMFTIGLPHLAQAFFSAASMLVAVPTGIQVFIWLATLWSGRPQRTLPMLWLTGFLLIFVAGGLTGVMLALVPFDWQVHDTHFVVAHMHYVLVGGMLFPLVAGLYHWFPLFTGRMPLPRLGQWAFWLTFVGFNGTFLIMHWTGLLGMPRRVYTYASGLGWDTPNLISSVFGFVMAAGIGMICIHLYLSLRHGRQADANPWQADTLEWACPLPPPAYNFASLPEVRTRHPMWDEPGLASAIARGDAALPRADHGRRETLGSDPVSGDTREVIHLPGNSFLPLLLGLALTGICLSLLLKAYLGAVVATLAALAVGMRWAWVNGAHPGAASETHGLPEGLALHSRTCDGPGLWGVGMTLLADGALYASLAFGWLYLWAVAPASALGDLPAPLTARVDPAAIPSTIWPAAIALVAATVGWRLMATAATRLCQGQAQHIARRLFAAGALGGLAAAGLIGWAWMTPLAPRQHAHDAVLCVFLAFVLLHLIIAAIGSVLLGWRVAHRFVSPHAPYEPLVHLQWWRFTVATLWCSVALTCVLPVLWGRP